jgi:hypothetical protein
MVAKTGLINNLSVVYIFYDQPTSVSHQVNYLDTSS